MFEVFSRARATTKTIEDVEDLPGWDTIKPEDRPEIVKLIDANAEKFAKARAGQKTTPAKKATPKKAAAAAQSSPGASTSAAVASAAAGAGGQSSGGDDTGGGGKTDKDAYVSTTDKASKDNSFRAFRVLVANVADTAGYLDKTELIRKYITKGNDGDSFKGDVYLTMSLLLPGKLVSEIWVWKHIYMCISLRLPKTPTE